MLDPADPARYSRRVVRTLHKPDHWRDRDRLVAELLAAARTEPAPPVLYYQADGDLLTVSRHRQALATGFRFVVADAELVEDLVDKARFSRLARRLDLPVPPARVLDWRQGPEAALELTFPLVLQPLTRDGLAVLRAHGLRIAGKALRVDVPTQLDALWPRVRAAEVPVLAQALIPGPESRIESYHAYVDYAGRTVGEFAGEKVRTYIRRSTATRPCSDSRPHPMCSPPAGTSSRGSACAASSSSTSSGTRPAGCGCSRSTRGSACGITWPPRPG